MYAKRTSPPPQEQQDEYYTFTDENTEKKVKQHISDINDVITDNDIKNIKIPNKKKISKKKAPKVVKGSGTIGLEGNPVTPWDVVD